jgi:electron transport complex protein RnfD
VDGGGSAASSAIGLGKSLFGGLGFNAFNPALVGRAILQAAFPAADDDLGAGPRWPHAVHDAARPRSLTVPFARARAYDAVTGPTPLASLEVRAAVRRHAETSELLLGLTSPGRLGESCALCSSSIGGGWLVAGAR